MLLRIVSATSTLVVLLRLWNFQIQKIYINWWHTRRACREIIKIIKKWKTIFYRPLLNQKQNKKMRVSFLLLQNHSIKIFARPTYLWKQKNQNGKIWLNMKFEIKLC